MRWGTRAGIKRGRRGRRWRRCIAFCCGWCRLRSSRSQAAHRRLTLHPRKTAIMATAQPAQFLGLELYADGRRRLPAETVRRFRNRLRSLQDRHGAGTATFDEILPRVRSWVAHSRHADTGRLREAIFRDTVYSVPGGPDRPGGASFAAVPGTTIPGTCALPTATGTTRATGTTIPASAWPARTHARAAAPKDAAGAPGISAQVLPRPG
jgi:hypothetical protein